MNSEDEQVYSVCLLQYHRMQSKHKQTKCEHSRTKFLQITAFSVGITLVVVSL